MDPTAQVIGRVLDVTDTVAVDSFAAELRTRHGGVDIVFSNAAARLTPAAPPAELVVPFVDTNNLGTTRVLRAFGSILRPGGRLLVVASSFGSLRSLPAGLRGRFDTDAMTLDDVDALMRAWRDAVVAGRAAAEGWPDWINIPSKVGQVAAVRVLAGGRRTTDIRDGTLVAAVCPGLIDTPASRPWFDDMSASADPVRGCRRAATARARPAGIALLRRACPVRKDHPLALRRRCCFASTVARAGRGPVNPPVHRRTGWRVFRSWRPPDQRPGTRPSLLFPRAWAGVSAACPAPGSPSSNSWTDRPAAAANCLKTSLV